MWCLQQQALLMYIKRVYHPFVVREPEVGYTHGMLWAVWLHTPHRTSSASVAIHLSLAVVVPSLKAVHGALNTIEDILCQSGSPCAGIAVLWDLFKVCLPPCCQLEGA